jgi:hypothetical protein
VAWRGAGSHLLRHRHAAGHRGASQGHGQHGSGHAAWTERACGALYRREKQLSSPTWQFGRTSYDAATHVFTPQPSQACPVLALAARMAPGVDAGAANGAAAGGSASPDLVVFVNGVRRTLPAGRAEATLLQYLRGASRRALRRGGSLCGAMTLLCESRRLRRALPLPRHAISSAARLMRTSPTPRGPDAPPTQRWDSPAPSSAAARVAAAHAPSWSPPGTPLPAHHCACPAACAVAAARPAACVMTLLPSLLLCQAPRG